MYQGSIERTVELRRGNSLTKLTCFARASTIIRCYPVKRAGGFEIFCLANARGKYRRSDTGWQRMWAAFATELFIPRDLTPLHRSTPEVHPTSAPDPPGDGQPLVTSRVPGQARDAVLGGSCR